MSEIKDGGPAFAAAAGNSTDFGVIQEGLSKREWFAGMALQGMLALGPIEGQTDFSIATQVKHCFQLADAMIQEAEGGK